MSWFDKIPDKIPDKVSDTSRHVHEPGCCPDMKCSSMQGSRYSNHI
jgi:hypothetical protein